MIDLNSTVNLDFSDATSIKVIGNELEGTLLLWLNSKGVNYLDVRENNAVIY